MACRTIDERHKDAFRFAKVHVQQQVEVCAVAAGAGAGAAAAAAAAAAGVSDVRDVCVTERLMD